MTWLFVGLGVWIAVAIPAALLIGRAVRVADDRRAAEADCGTGPRNVVATEAPPAEVSPLWTGPAITPSPPPLGAQSRRRPPVIRAPISRTERNPSHRDSGVL